MYVLFWKFILTLIYTFSENNISKLRLPWHTFLQVQKCLYWEALSNARWNFFYFKSGEPIVVIILSLMMLFYLYNRVFFFLGCDCQFLCILTWGYYDAIWFFFFIFHGWKYFFHLFIFKIFNDFSILVTFKCICINGQIQMTTNLHLMFNSADKHRAFENFTSTFKCSNYSFMRPSLYHKFTQNRTTHMYVVCWGYSFCLLNTKMSINASWIFHSVSVLMNGMSSIDLEVYMYFLVPLYCTNH